jgi:hypothetical protein
VVISFLSDFSGHCCVFQMRQPHTGLLSPISKNSTTQVPQAVDALPETPTVGPPVVLRRRPECTDYHEMSLFSSSSQGAQKSASERNNEGKAVESVCNKN